MTPTEVVKLVRMVRAIAPAQKIDDYTADAWHPLLEDLNPVDAAEALVRLGKRLAFIAPSDIRAEVRVIRSERMKHADESFRFKGDPDDVALYMRQLTDHRRRVGDGEVIPPPPAIEAPKDVRPLIESIAKRKRLPKGRAS